MPLDMEGLWACAAWLLDVPAVRLGVKMGKPPGNDRGKVWAAAAAAAACTVAESDNREVEICGGMQGATLPVEGALSVASECEEAAADVVEDEVDDDEEEEDEDEEKAAVSSAEPRWGTSESLLEAASDGDGGSPFGRKAAAGMG